MRTFGTIAIATVHQLEAGDLIALELVGTVIAGKVSGVVYLTNDLTEEQRKYMKENDLNIPEEWHIPVAGQSSYLVFGDFHGSGLTDSWPGHMYLEGSRMISVFTSTSQKDVRG